jgi:hypothetical protein
MDDYHGILNCINLKYGTYEVFDIYGDQNIGEKYYNKY